MVDENKKALRFALGYYVSSLISSGLLLFFFSACQPPLPLIETPTAFGLVPSDPRRARYVEPFLDSAYRCAHGLQPLSRRGSGRP